MIAVTQTYADLIISAFEMNDPSVLLDSINMGAWHETEKELVTQHLKELMQFSKEEELTYRKIKGDKSIHLLKDETILLSCRFDQKDHYNTLIFGPIATIRHLEIPYVTVQDHMGNTSITVNRKPIIKEHDILADFDQALKKGNLDKQFTFDSLALINFNKFKVIYDSKVLFLKSNKLNNNVSSARGTYYSDEYKAELDIIIGYVLKEDHYHIMLFTFTPLVEPAIKKKEEEYDGLIEEPYERPVKKN